ncbi:hypothetical protein BIV57_05380 [Mangrovactinospora gilvigrisea]|uniref:HTH cro/C1-type domain-containing protein n=1 Tax=Mangrovactinospora gilvigrisea TaxID=1428644 RepID=A0A1J7BIM0_9ACTN|nr:helix-turn-helix transcriptional regulator [Mangrovactinospora gilvigrisea]OIV38515.1 hypothetical protein BIV57_05380 [Mangrovactinospora gilvigrisea]
MGAEPRISEFLKARRAAVEPAQLGLTGGAARRRVRGLRREEAAAVSGISVDYYTRIEQGRGGNVSDDVLRAVARGLRMTADEHAYLRNASHWAATGRGCAPDAPPEPPLVVRPGVQALLDSMETVPALLYGRALDVLAWNRLGGLLWPELVASPPEDRNSAKRLFLDGADAELRHPDLAELRRLEVAVLRAESGRNPEGRRLCQVVGELRERSTEFRRLWESQVVEEKTHGVKRVRLPSTGQLLELRYETLRLPEADSEMRIVTYSAVPGSETAEALRELAAGVTA